MENRPFVYLAIGSMQQESICIFTEEPTANVISALQWQGFEPTTIDSPIVQALLRSHLPSEPARSPAQPPTRRTTKNKKGTS